jgi:hypothetical protein
MMRSIEGNLVNLDVRKVVGVSCFGAWDGRKWAVVGFADTQQSESQLVVGRNAVENVAGNT